MGYKEMNENIITEFRENDGRVGGMFEGAPLLLLHTRGAKTGQERVNPLMFRKIDEHTWAVFASKGGADTNPDWFHNLLADPEVEVEMGSDVFAAVARVAEGEERDEIWEAQKADVAAFAEYEEKTEREIPVVILERAD